MIQRIWIAAAGLIALMVLVWFAALWVPANKRLDDEIERRDTAQAALDDLEAERQRLVIANRDVPVLQTQLLDLAAAVPERPALADFMIAVATAEAESGVDVTSVTTGDPVADGEGLVQIGVDLDVRASYFQLLDFMNRMSRLERIYVVDAVDIDALGDEAATAPPELDAVLQGRVFTVGDADDIQVPQPVRLSATTSTTSTTSTTTTTTTQDPGR